MPLASGNIDPPHVVLIDRQARQLHQDLQSLLATGCVGVKQDEIEWLRDAYAGLLGQTQKVVRNPKLMLSHVGGPEKVSDLLDVYLGIGQIIATLSTYLDEIEKSQRAPMGFAPRSE